MWSRDPSRAAHEPLVREEGVERVVRRQVRRGPPRRPRSRAHGSIRAMKWMTTPSRLVTFQPSNASDARDGDVSLAEPAVLGDVDEVDGRVGESWGGGWD